MVVGLCASVIPCIGSTRSICRAGVDLRESRLSLVPYFLNHRKFLEQTGESFIPWHTKLPSLSCGKARLFLDLHISITIPTPPTRIPNLTTLHPTLAIDYFLSRLLGPLSK